MDRIDPQPPSGFRDLLPADAAARQMMMDRIAGVFRRHGLSSIDTPALERVDVLTGGESEMSKQMYRARLTETDEPLGLRFDLTVPLARYVSAHADELTFPFARYHIGNVWRGEHAQAGRYRQFIQCDADIVGPRSMVADAEIIALVYDVFKDLGLADKVSIGISNRKVLDGLSDFLTFDAERTPAVLRAIDKRARVGWEAVAAELTAKVGLDGQQVDAIQEFLNLTADSAEELLDKAHTMLQFSPRSHEGIEELRQLAALLDGLDVPRSAWSVDLAIARGLGYYTGTVFETMLTALPAYGSVCSGGRYDDLVSRFAPLKLSGVGMSVGMDRLFSALDELGLVPPTAASPVRAAVLDFDADARPTVLKVVTDLRASGVSAMLYLGSDDSLKGQLGWAVKAGFPYAIIIGAKEHERGVGQLKNLAERTQDEVPLAELAGRLTS